MGCEWSSIAVPLLLLLHLYFLLLCWQTGSVTGATTVSDGGGARGSPYDRTTAKSFTITSSHCTVGKTAVDCEGKALNTFLDDLGATGMITLSCSVVEREQANVVCYCTDNGTCSIVGMNLSGRKFGGVLNFPTDSFKELIALDLSNNQLTGSISDSLTQLQSLRQLYLSDNYLDGTIPQNLTALKSLEILDLSGNKLSGPLPPTITDCQNLKELYLRLNFLSGNIPGNLNRLSSLEALDLYSNSLSGHIPKELGKLSNLSFLNLDENNLDGELPSELGDLVNLQYLYLTSNYFTGKIPEKYNQLINLEVFSIGGNSLSGHIPSYLGNCTNLTAVILLGNNFEGNLPAEIFSLPKLQRLWVSDVSKPGITFPKEGAKQETMVSVILRNCGISGSIPKYIDNWPNLSYLDLSFNNLNGPIPESLGRLYKLILTSNRLEGPVPSWISGKPDIYPSAELSYNNFNEAEEKIASGIADITIRPTRNSITRMIDPRNCGRKHSSLFINCGGEQVRVGKDLYQNDTETSSFSKSSSGDWAYSFSGDYLFRRNNASILVRNLACEVPNSEAKLDNNFRLAPVALTYYGLCLRKGKYTVTLRFAETLYYKEEDHSIVGKRVFDVYSQGRIERKDLEIKKIPGVENEGKREKFEAKVGRDGSLVIRFFWAGKGSMYNPPGLQGPVVSAISITRVPRKLYPWEIALIVIGCILAVLLLLALMWRMGWIGDRELRETKIEIGERTFTLKQIINATQKFSKNKEIGSGRSGIVYKADLPNLTVAVKKLLSHSKTIDEIASEVYANKALKLKHDNLVQLLDTYSKNRLHLLIYEYMEIGSLAKALFGPNPTVQLNWEARFIICKGVAKGLKYLHERNPPIIHRNIKASNILLDASFNPKITDFGLAKLYEEENPFIAIGAGEQFLYMAPEYVTRRAMTVKVDVYSFGILLLEIVSGKPNADYRVNQETVFLLDTASNLHARGRLGELVDSRLDHYDYEQANNVLKLAMMCTEQSPLLRPIMSQVVSVFEGEKTVEQISKEIAPSA